MSEQRNLAAVVAEVERAEVAASLSAMTFACQLESMAAGAARNRLFYLAASGKPSDSRRRGKERGRDCRRRRAADRKLGATACPCGGAWRAIRTATGWMTATMKITINIGPRLSRHMNDCEIIRPVLTHGGNGLGARSGKAFRRHRVRAALGLPGRAGEAARPSAKTRHPYAGTGMEPLHLAYGLW